MYCKRPCIDVRLPARDDTRPMPDADLLDSPLAQAEFLAVDTETNGLARRALRADRGRRGAGRRRRAARRWESLVGVAQPLARGIQRFTGITQAMVDDGAAAGGGAARAGASCCAGACWSPTTRASTGACCARRSRGRRSSGRTRRCCARSRSRAGSRRCSAARARRARRRAGHRGRRDPPRAARRADVRAGASARCSGGCARTRRRSATRSRCSGRASAPRRGARPAAKRAARRAPGPAGLPNDPGVYIFRDADGRPLYVGKSVDLRTRARAHFTRRDLDRAGRARRPPGDGVRARRAAARGPADQGAAPAGQRARQGRADGYVYLRCRLDIPFPILEVAREPAPGHAVCVGPRARARRRGRAGRAAQLAVRPAPLRARAAAPRAPVGLRADGPLPLALPRRPGPERLPRAARRGARAVRRPRRRRGAARARRRADARGVGRAALRARRVAAAAARAAGGAARPARRRAARDPRRRAARARAAPGRARRASTRSGSRAGASWTGARCRATRPSSPRAPRARCAAAPARGLGGWLPAEAVAEARLVGAWIAAHEPPRLELEPRPDHASAGRVHRGPGCRPPQDSTESGPIGSRSCAGARPVAGAAAGRRATTCVTRRPVNRATRCGKSVLQPLRAAPRAACRRSPRRARRVEVLGHRVHRVGVADQPSACKAARRASRRATWSSGSRSASRPASRALRRHQQRGLDRRPLGRDSARPAGAARGVWLATTRTLAAIRVDASAPFVRRSRGLPERQLGDFGRDPAGRAHRHGRADRGGLPAGRSPVRSARSAGRRGDAGHASDHTGPRRPDPRRPRQLPTAGVRATAGSACRGSTAGRLSSCPT